MSEPKQRPVCMDPAHINEPTTLQDDDWARCDVCGKERLSFQPPDEEDTLDALMADAPKPYILWINYHTEGWQPSHCESLAECYRTALNMCASDFLITGPPIEVGFVDLSKVITETKG